MVSQAWKELSHSERTKWVEKGRIDRERYEREKRNYTGPWRIPYVKNPNAPKKPMSSFLAFSNERRRALAQANPNMNGTELSCFLAKLWKESPEHIKQRYKERELREREMFKKSRVEWQRRQELASLVSQWTKEIPNGQELCSIFMDDESGNHSDLSTSSVTPLQGMHDGFHNMDKHLGIVSSSCSPTRNALPASVIPSCIPTTSKTLENNTSLSFGFSTWSQTNAEMTANCVPIMLPPLRYLNTHPVAVASATSGYDHYSMDDILQDDELFQDFSPGDVPSVPLSSSNDWNNPFPQW